MPHYEWQEHDGGRSDVLLRDGVPVGEVAALGSLWVAQVRRPSRLGSLVAENEASALKTALADRERAKESAMRNARFSWDGTAEEELQPPNC